MIKTVVLLCYMSSIASSFGFIVQQVYRLVGVIPHSKLCKLKLVWSSMLVSSCGEINACVVNTAFSRLYLAILLPSVWLMSSLPCGGQLVEQSNGVEGGWVSLA